MQTTSAPAAAAIANVVLSHPILDRMRTSIICDRFDACELALRAAQQFPEWQLISVTWNR